MPTITPDLPPFTVTDAKFGVYGPFPTLREARTCTAFLEEWVITDANDMVIDSAEREAKSKRA